MTAVAHRRGIRTMTVFFRVSTGLARDLPAVGFARWSARASRSLESGQIGWLP